MRFTQSFLDEIRQRLPVSQVVSRRVQLKRHGREHIGLSPFKVEKTPSFTVNDQKGFYHCFATGEHGDIFTFLMKTEGLDFPEAVEQLAGEAGVAIPIATPQMQQAEDERGRLCDVMEAAAQYFKQSLKDTLGRDALSYLQERGVPHDLQERFRIGYAPNNRSGLKSHLEKAGFKAHEMIKAGLLIAGDDIAVPYDRFRNRIMFPICDLKGRVIAFGGRALDPNQPAKYLNSPETPLFHKGHVLFNAGQARQSVYETGQVLIVEGYMDVIALAGAGFHNAVAPLGTALTSNQLKLLWRMADEPVLCFDGDGAGRKAAYRAVEMTLPNLIPGKSLYFAFMPEGLDPDDLVKSEGPEAMHDILGKARPLFEVLWEKEWQAGEWNTPERRAALEKQLHSFVEQIEDASVKYQYQSEIKRKLYEAWRPKFKKQNSQRSSYQASSYKGKGRQGGYNKRFGGPEPASHSLLNSSLVTGEHSQMSTREALLMMTVLNHPSILDDYIEEFSELNFESKMLTELRDAILHTYSLQNSLDIQAFHTHLNHLGQENALIQIKKAITHNSDWFVQADASPTAVEAGLKHLIALHHKQLELKRDLKVALNAYNSEETQENYDRLCNIRLELLSAEGREVEIPGYYEAKEEVKDVESL